jgi:hypothetical protein
MNTVFIRIFNKKPEYNFFRIFREDLNTIYFDLAKNLNTKRKIPPRNPLKSQARPQGTDYLKGPSQTELQQKTCLCTKGSKEFSLPNYY